MNLKSKTIRLLVASFVLFVCTPGISQNEFRLPLSDAIKYTEDTPAGTIRVAIIKAYTLDRNYSQNDLVSNVFLTDVQNSISTALLATTLSAPVFSSQSASDGSPLGAPLIDALGTVIAKRFKEELTLAFLQSFREKLKANNSYLAELFPNAKNVLLNDDPFNHKVWLASFRGALDEDLKLLPDNLPVLLKQIKKINGLTEDQKNILDTLITAYTPALELARNPQKSYASVEKFLNDIKGASYLSQNVKASLNLSYVLLKELGNSSYTDCTGKNALNKLISNPEIARNFIGFSIEKHKTTLQAVPLTYNGVPTNLYKATHDSTFAKNVFKSVQYLNKVIAESKSINESIITLKNKDRNSTIKLEDYQALVNKSLDAIAILINDEAVKIIDPKGSLPARLNQTIQHTRAIVDFASKINSNINAKEYSKIVSHTLSFITDYIKDQDLLDQSIPLKEFIKYADLAINLSSATTSEEMVSALEGAALPSQSYRLKRNSYFSISLNSYAGVFLAREFLLNDNAKNESATLTGFKAPIGIGLNWGIGKSDKPTDFSKYPTKTIINANKEIGGYENYFSGHSFSVYVSIIDVGAITTFRLTDDETPVEDIQWQNVFAPGLYFVWGIGKTPLALSIGGQYGPQLRNVEAMDGIATPTIDSRAFRVGFSLTVDIPLLHLYTKTEKVTFK